MEQQRIEQAIDKLFLSISRNLYLGDLIDFPHSLKPAKTNQANELTDWCFGFMEAVGVNEELWLYTIEMYFQL